MSEVLRDLVVSLSLDGDNFSRNFTSINKQIQEAESEFRRAASGVENFEKSVSGTRSQLSSLQQKLAIISALIRQPKLLILDEPFVGLDPVAAHLLKGRSQGFASTTTN